MVKWSNTAVCKTAIRGFDSHSSLNEIKAPKKGRFLFAHNILPNLWITCVLKAEKNIFSPLIPGLK